MLALAVLLIALTVWFYAAAALQFRGYDWADATCRDMPTFCGSPHYVAIAAVVAIGICSLFKLSKNLISRLIQSSCALKSVIVARVACSSRRGS